MTFLKLPAPFIAREAHKNVGLSECENDFSQNASYPFSLGGKLVRACDRVNAKMTFLKMPASFFVQGRIFSSVELSEWKTDFFQNVSYPLRLRNSLKREAE